MANWKFAWLLKSYYVDHLSKIPKEEWISMLKEEVRLPEKNTIWSAKAEKPSSLGERETVKTRDGEEIDILLYKPENKEKAAPVYFHMHGGGFCVGSAEIDDEWCKKIAEKLQCVVVNIDYRLAPEYPYPTALHDCEDVIQYVTEHAGQYGIDLEKMSVGGVDAGGALAAALCLQKEKKPAAGFRSLVLNCPSLDHSVKNVPGDSPAAVENYMMQDMCYCTQEEGEDPLVSPVFAADEQLGSLPPVILLTAEMDHEAEAAEGWAIRVQRRNVEVTARRMLDVKHYFTVKDSEDWNNEKAEEALEFLVKGMKRYFK